MNRSTLYYRLSLIWLVIFGRWRRIFVVRVKARRSATMTIPRRESPASAIWMAFCVPCCGSS